MKVVERKATALVRPKHGARSGVSAEHARNLLGTFQKFGVLQPLVVRKGTNEVIVGDVRGIVAKKAGLKVPVIEAKSPNSMPSLWGWATNSRPRTWTSMIRGRCPAPL